MNSPIIITRQVLSRLRQLPVSDRISIARALTNDLLLDGDDPMSPEMSPLAASMYEFFKFNVEHDSARLGTRLTS